MCKQNVYHQRVHCVSVEAGHFLHEVYLGSAWGTNRHAYISSRCSKLFSDPVSNGSFAEVDLLLCPVPFIDSVYTCEKCLSYLQRTNSDASCFVYLKQLPNPSLSPTNLLSMFPLHMVYKYILNEKQQLYVHVLLQCVKNSRELPLATVNMVKDYPEMTDWVHSVHCKVPFYISNNNYTNIAVDRVQAADQSMYNVLLLATGMFTFESNIMHVFFPHFV